MHRHCGTNNRAPRWTFTDPCKPEVKPGAREESASPAWQAASAMNARDTTKVYIWRLDTGCGLTLYRKFHSHNTPGKRYNNTWVEPLAGYCTTSSTRQREQVWQKCNIQKNWCAVTVAPTYSIIWIYLQIFEYLLKWRSIYVGLNSLSFAYLVDLFKNCFVINNTNQNTSFYLEHII